jgi:hypothetical protein
MRCVLLVVVLHKRGIGLEERTESFEIIATLCSPCWMKPATSSKALAKGKKAANQ